MIAQVMINRRLVQVTTRALLLQTKLAVKPTRPLLLQPQSKLGVQRRSLNTNPYQEGPDGKPLKGWRKLLAGRGFSNPDPDKVFTLNLILRPDIIPLMGLAVVAVAIAISYCIRNVLLKRDLIISEEDKNLPRFFRHPATHPQKLLVINRYKLKVDNELERLRREIYDIPQHYDFMTEEERIEYDKKKRLRELEESKNPKKWHEKAYENLLKLF